MVTFILILLLIALVCRCTHETYTGRASNVLTTTAEYPFLVGSTTEGDLGRMTAEDLFVKENLFQRILEQVYPVGSLYFNGTSNENPEFLLGFGTWSPFAEGRVPVGASADSTLGDIGGSSTHTLTTEELPAHHHLISHNENGAHFGYSDTVTSGSRYVHTTTSTSQLRATQTSSVGSGESFSVQNPYIVVRIWIRTV